ncbi:hypothetical protein EMIHUDRAFT_249424 [Emiliania huxleyi CCMP1516]|uniref:Uncharacterized protein n=2 Tax=Emiliania huxleyi TaxID=2903 RepID=A0A0D3I945_EMIH1|nr:hypothetical protein EMIHUDRAFT_249424 [Emiliania huxleyi CCMP1516]EOD07780.1 hypothetical protein EMIHUDRAFT_249424 [Emiliania huxleyi CCMP1516]|eukprot:XP_005760209.1 hypothetical protein EMIHUDRAFT_249424 [Emiliania huxleyi CCMP1516]
MPPCDAVAERFLDRYVFQGGITGRYRMAEQRAVCAAVPVRALLQLPLLGVNRGYKGLYGGGWPLRGMGAAGTALGAADARTNEHYEIGTIFDPKITRCKR